MPGQASRLDPWGTFGAMKLVYKPFGIILGIVAGLLSKKVFEAVWGIIDKEEPPEPTDPGGRLDEGPRGRRGPGRHVQGHARRGRPRRGQELLGTHLFGVWPGDKRQEKSQAARAVR